jgi:hypothetical protein
MHYEVTKQQREAGDNQVFRNHVTAKRGQDSTLQNVNKISYVQTTVKVY